MELVLLTYHWHNFESLFLQLLLDPERDLSEVGQRELFEHLRAQILSVGLEHLRKTNQLIYILAISCHSDNIPIVILLVGIILVPCFQDFLGSWTID